MVVDYLLHIHLEQGLGPFHLEKRKERKPRSMSLQLLKGEKSQQQCDPKGETYVCVMGEISQVSDFRLYIKEKILEFKSTDERFVR